MSGGVPAGWVLVPVEPTEAMLQAAMDCYEGANPEFLQRMDRAQEYAAMLAATPTPPPSRDADVERALRQFVASLTDNGRNRGSCLSIRHDDLNRLIRAALQALGERG